MTTASRLSAAGLLAIAACGGGTSSGGGGVPINAFTGTLTITSALPPTAPPCTPTNTKTVTFTAGGADVHQVTVAGGDCVQFVNADAAGHQPASIGTPACPELNAPTVLVMNQPPYTTPPLNGPKTCNWQDALNPPGGGGGGGY
ncbi:MAG TPA: hypothetical protein VIW03_02270 [Anaeromyxobacter sp.]